MKCGICGNTERIMFETNFSYYGKSSQRKDSSGEPIKQVNDDGSVRMKPIYDAADMTEHKRFEHPVEVEALARKRQETKATNAQLKETKDNNIAKVRRVGHQAVALPVLDYDDYWSSRHGGQRKEGAYHLTTSHVDGSMADVAQRAVSDGRGEESVWYGGVNRYRQITNEDLTELNTLDKAIEELQAQRDSIASQMYERGTSLTNQHMVDLDDAATAAQQELERMLVEGDELDTDEGRLTDPAVEAIVEAAMSNHPGKFIRYSEEEISEALGAYGY